MAAVVTTKCYQKTKGYTGHVVLVDGREVGVVFRNGGPESSWFGQVGIGHKGVDLPAGGTFQNRVDAVVAHSALPA